MTTSDIPKDFILSCISSQTHQKILIYWVIYTRFEELQSIKMKNKDRYKLIAEEVNYEPESVRLIILGLNKYNAIA